MCASPADTKTTELNRLQSKRTAMNTRFTLALAAVSFWAAPAFAHGEKEHATSHKYDASKVEVTDFGQEGDPRKVTRTIRIEMADSMRFSPATVSVKRGE